jgi:glycosyltransferase involved in cell wall biosynthesis
VVSTRFPHAVELLGGGAGLLVPHEDPEAIAAALRSVFTEPGLASRLAEATRPRAQSLSWDRVGHSYAALVASVVARRIEARR